MPRLSIVISAVGSIESLEGTLVSVLENRPADSEILVALEGPYSDPYDLKGEVCFMQARHGGTSTTHFNQALAAARAPFVHLLSSGCTVTEGWTERALARFGDRQVGSVVPLVVDVDNPQRIVAAGVGYQPSGRRLMVASGATELTPEIQARVLGPTALAGFYRKSALDQAGGFSRNLGMIQADVDVALTLQRLGFTVAIEPQSRVLSSGEVDAGQSPFQRALYDERLFWHNLAPQERLGALVAHGGRIAWELARSFPRPRMISQAIARTWGCCQMVTYLGRGWESEAVAGKFKPTQWRVDPAQPGCKISESPKAATPTR